MKPSVVLLDLDGTLSDNYEGIARSLRYALVRSGACDPGEGALRDCVGPPLRESLARLLADVRTVTVEQALGVYRERYAAVGWRENVAYPGIHAALGALANAGMRMFVCTSKPVVFATRIVAHFGFNTFVERVYGADLAGALDDKGKLLAHAIRSERLDPTCCIMVGDRYHDVRAAESNGVRSAGVLWGYGSREELAGADRLLSTPSELVSLAA